MAEYKTSKQVNYGFGLSFEATGKAPVIAKRIWATLADAQAYVDSSTDTATAGLTLVVAKDTVAANNGVYRVVKAAGEDGNTKGELVKLSEGGDIPDVDALIKAAIAALDAEKSGSDAGTTVKVTEADGKITAVAVSHTKGKIETGNANLVDGGTVKTYVDNAINTAVASSYKVKGCKDTYADLPATGNVEGDVWNIVQAFELDGKKYPAGTNVVWVGLHTDGELVHKAHWDFLGGTYDLSIYKEKQDAVSISGNAGKTVTAISQDENGKISATTADIAITQTQVTGLADKLSSLTNGVSSVSKAAADAKAVADAAVPKTTKVNGNALDGDITINAGSIPISEKDATTVSKAINDLETETGKALKLGQENSSIGTDTTLAGDFVLDKANNQRVTLADDMVLVVEDDVSGIKITSTGIFLGSSDLVNYSTISGGSNGVLQLGTNDDAGGVTIQGLATPTDKSAADVAVNKEYVDNAVGGVDVGVKSVCGLTGAVASRVPAVKDQRDLGYAIIDAANDYLRVRVPSPVGDFLVKNYEKPASVTSEALSGDDGLLGMIGKLELRTEKTESGLTWGSW